MNPAKSNLKPTKVPLAGAVASEDAKEFFVPHSPSGDLLRVEGVSSSPVASDSVPSVTLQPERGWQRVDLRELWVYRELLWFLSMRDVQVRYKQTVLGAAWAIIQPVMAMVVFSIFFGKFGKIPSDGFPYPIFAYTALLPWQLFANTLGQTSGSLVGNTNLLTKIYFPRLIIPLSAALSGLVDFCIAFLVLMGMMVYYRITPGWGIVLLPVFLLFAITAALSMGLWLSALNMRYRDVRYVVPFMTQLWMFATPVAYPASLVPEKYRLFYALNPMVGVVEGFRWALLGGAHTLSLPAVCVSVLATLALLVGGLFYFRRFEASFADLA